MAAKLRVDKLVEGNAVWHEHKIEDIVDLSSPWQYKGDISVAGDFPTSAEVQNGWVYRILADVTDNDPTKTNTGDSFDNGDEIAWNGTGWTIIGNELIYVPYIGATQDVDLGTNALTLGTKLEINTKVNQSLTVEAETSTGFNLGPIIYAGDEGDSNIPLMDGGLYLQSSPGATPNPGAYLYFFRTDFTQLGYFYFDHNTGDLDIADFTSFNFTNVDVTLADNLTMTFGDGSDLVIYSDGTQGIIDGVGYIDFNLTPTVTAQEGRLHWNADDGTLSLGMPGGNVEYQLGQEELLRVRNITGAQINNGAVVYISGASGSRPTVALADADVEITANTTIGLATEDIPDANTGYITTFGLVRDLDTSSFTEGDRLYLSQTLGGITNVKPTQPAHGVQIGFCIFSNPSSGIIFVEIEHDGDLKNLDDVLLTSVADGEILKYNSTNSLWENQPVTASQGVKLELAFNDAYNTAYSELTYSGNNITNVDIWETAAKITKLFSKVINYTGSNVTSTTTTDELTSAVLTKTLTYIGNNVDTITTTIT